MKVLIPGYGEEKGEYSWLAKNRSFQANVPCQTQPHFIINFSVCARQHCKYRDLRHLKRTFRR